MTGTNHMFRAATYRHFPDAQADNELVNWEIVARKLSVFSSLAV
jgi:hypothetical protein